MIDLDRINIDSANWAAGRVRDHYPLPETGRVADLPNVNEWLAGLHEQIDGWLGVIGAIRRPGRAWVDVQLSDGRWVGQWVDDCPTEAAVASSYWWSEPIIAAGIGLKDSSEARAAHEARLASGDILALLGEEWAP